MKNIFKLSAASLMQTMKTGTAMCLMLAAVFTTASCSDDNDEGGNTPREYTISAPAPANGDITITVDGQPATKAGRGETVTLTAAADPDYEFVQWVVTSGGVSLSPNAQATTVTFTMPAANVAVRAEFRAEGGGDPPQGQVLDLGDGSDEFEITEDMTLEYPNTYILKGFVYVTDGATLTIEPGVVIRGDKATTATLIIEPGADIMAEGTEELPIVFTSNQAKGQRKNGDWGGLIICGLAPHNLGTATIEGGPRTVHGGNNPADNSGVLSYVRIEFAGQLLDEAINNSEINGLTLGSVGSGTRIDHIQVSYSGDDSFEWFGGSANAKYLVAYSGIDDDFDTDNGFDGKIQYALSVRNPQIADQSASNGFESDNNSGSSDTPGNFTTCTFANVSLFGPVANPASYTEQGATLGISSGANMARFQAGLHLRRNTKLNIYNSVVAAFPIGVIIEGATTQASAIAGELAVKNCVMAGMVQDFQDAQYWTDGTIYNPTPGTFTSDYFNAPANANRKYETVAELGLSVTPGVASPLAFPTVGSPLLTGAAWTDAAVATGFDKVTYIGAFGPTETATDNWTSGWCNFDPQNTDY